MNTESRNIKIRQLSETDLSTTCNGSFGPHAEPCGSAASWMLEITYMNVTHQTALCYRHLLALKQAADYAWMQVEKGGAK